MNDKQSDSKYGPAIDLIRLLLRDGPRIADDCEMIALMSGVDVSLLRDAANLIEVTERAVRDDDRDWVLWYFGNWSDPELVAWLHSSKHIGAAEYMPLNGVKRQSLLYRRVPE